MNGIIYKHHFLVNLLIEGKPKTLVARSQRLPEANEKTNAFIDWFNDIVEIDHNSIVAEIKPKPIL